MQRNKIALLLLTGSLFALGSCFAEQTNAILPVPTPPSSNPDQLALGKALYFTTVFSSNGSQSCNSCHQLDRGGVDNLPRYSGIDKKPGLLNTPTVLNSSLNFRQFWDGRAKTIDEVVEDHLQDPTIYANTWPSVIAKITHDSALKDPFKKAYHGEISPNTIKNALKTYVASLLTPQSPFDRYLQGDKTAISQDAIKGYQLFISYGCVTCHQGPNMGSNLYQRFGIYQNYYANKTNMTSADLGLYNVTKDVADKYVFKVPSLRNIALTGPYLHDGSVATLEEVIQLMGIYQVGQPIQSFEIPFIVKFLETLTGKIPEPKKTD